MAKKTTKDVSTVKPPKVALTVNKKERLCIVCNSPCRLIESEDCYRCMGCGLMYPINNEWGNWEEKANKL